MNKFIAKNTLYNDPIYDVVVDKKRLEQDLKEKDELIAELQKQLDEKTKIIEGLTEKQKNIENSASYQMFLNIQKKLEEKEKELLIERTTNDRWYKREVKRRDEKIRRQRQQLKSQTAEIVEKIKTQLIKRLNTIAGYGKMTTDELSFFIENEFGSDLDTILKEYQK